MNIKKRDILHFLFCFAIVFSFYAISGMEEFAYAFLGLCVAVLCGISEELVDKHILRTGFNWRDIAFDLCGAFAGITLCSIIYIIK